MDMLTPALVVEGEGEVGDIGENGTVGEAGGEEKKTSLGEMTLGVRRCFPIMDTPMAGCGWQAHHITHLCNCLLYIFTTLNSFSMVEQ